MRHHIRALVCGSLVCVTEVIAQPIALPQAPAGVTTFDSEGFQFSLIGSPNNAAFHSSERPDWYIVQGRGSVPYSYGMARTEVTTAQWMEFVNTFSTQGGEFTDFGWPIRWGARLDPNYQGPGWRWELDPNRPNAAAVPVWGISWRDSARLCNWLHNGRSSDPESLTHGAYDTSTFGYPDDNFFNGFTDQVRRSPGARFWIPDLDEWIKGAFFDPAQDRWWLSHYGSDERPVYGWPSEPGAESSAGLPFHEDDAAYYIPLNAYGAQSAYGLLSTSGGPHEWFEDAVGVVKPTGLPAYRLYYSSGGGGINGDLIFQAGSAVELPHTASSQSIRIAASIPSPSTLVALLLFSSAASMRRRVS